MADKPSDNTNLIELFARTFNNIDSEVIKAILNRGVEIDLQTGDYLLRQGDKADVLYILISGRLRAIQQDDKGDLRVLGDIGAGEPVGEFAFFTDEPRMASIIAIRDSIVLQFNKASYEQLVKEKPQLATILVQFIIKRLKRNTFELSRTSPPKNIALIHLQDEDDLNEYTQAILQEFGKMDIPTKVYSFGARNIEDQNILFNNLEQHDGLNIMTCSAEHKEWSKRCIIYADLVIVASNFYAEPNLYPIEKELGLYSQNILNKKNVSPFTTSCRCTNAPKHK